MSSSYKRLIAERGIEDETYDEKKTALFRIQGTSPNNMQAIQVDLVSSLVVLFCPLPKFSCRHAAYVIRNSSRQ